MVYAGDGGRHGPAARFYQYATAASENRHSSVKADNTMFIGNDPVTDDTMIAELTALTEGKKIPRFSSARIKP